MLLLFVKYTKFIFFEYVMITLVSVVGLLISVAYYTLAERKIIAAVQRRVGCNVVGVWGTLQPLADGLKLVLKEVVMPRTGVKILFIASPILTFTASITCWSVIPSSVDGYMVDLPLGVLYLLVLSTINAHVMLLSGLASYSQYALLASIRTASQAISYEIVLFVSLLPVFLMAKSTNFIDIVYTQQSTTPFFFSLLPLFFIFCVCILAETNRVPFDLPEAESELVAGYNVEAT